MRLRLGLLLFLLCASPALAQTIPVGPFTAGHSVRCANSTCTVFTDSGGAAGASQFGSGYLTEMGITNTGLPVCVNDALTTNPSGYHQLCMGASTTIGSTTGGFVTYNALGGATQQGLNFNINGSNYGFPGPGNGNVMGPNTSSIGALPVFNGTSGTLLADTTAYPAGGKIFANLAGPSSWSANALYDGLRVSVNNFPLANEFGGGTFALPQAIVGALNIPATASNPHNAAGFAVSGYASSSSTVVGAVGVFGGGTPSVSNTSAWGSNFLVNNCAGSINCVTGLGTINNALWGIEVDANVYKSGASAPVGVSLNGIQVVGGSETQVGAGGHSFAVAVAPLGTFANPQIPWQVGFVTTDAAAQTGLSLGSIGATSSVTDSQTLCMTSYGGGAALPACFQNSAAGVLKYEGVLQHQFFVAGVTPPVFSVGQFSAVFGLQFGSPPAGPSGTNTASLPSIGTFWEATDGGGNILSSSINLTSAGHHVVGAPTAQDFFIGGTNAFKVASGTPASATTGIAVLYNNGSATTLGTVTVGAADSGGAGFRLLRVAN